MLWGRGSERFVRRNCSLWLSSLRRLTLRNRTLGRPRGRRRVRLCGGRRFWFCYRRIVAAFELNRSTFAAPCFLCCLQACLGAFIVAASHLAKRQALHLMTI